MKLLCNPLGIREIACDHTFNSNLTTNTSDHIKINIDDSMSYDIFYQNLANIDIKPEDGSYYQPQQAHDNCEKIICFYERENIIKIIDYLEEKNYVTIWNEGIELIKYRDSFFTSEQLAYRNMTKEILKYQGAYCNLGPSLQQLKEALLSKLKLTFLKNTTKYSENELKLREDFIKKITDHLQNSDEELLALIKEGKKLYHHSNDLADILLRAGEDVIQKYHVKNHLVYRRETYAHIVKARKVFSITRQSVNLHAYDVCGDASQAFEHYLEAATPKEDYLGSPEAQFELGRMYRLNAVPDSKKTKKNNERAVIYYQQASERNMYEALVKLGKMYMTGDGVKQKDNQKAMQYFSQAIGNDIHMWDSEPLGYVLSLVNDKDPFAMDFLNKVLTYHKNQFIDNLNLFVTLIDQHGVTMFSEVASKFRYGSRNYIIPPNEYYGTPIIHLQQIHYFADDGDSLYMRHIDKKLSCAQEVLITIYELFAKSFNKENTSNYFISICEKYREKLVRQNEESKYSNGFFQKNKQDTQEKQDNPSRDPSMFLG